jgi:hypothetical protein
MMQNTSIEASANVIPDFSCTIPGEVGYAEFNFTNPADQFLNAGFMPQPPLGLQADSSLYPSFDAAGTLAFADYAFGDVSKASVLVCKHLSDASLFQQSNSAIQQHSDLADNSLSFSSGFHEYYQ